ncbi:hypothetical protein PS9374_05397 [Planomonospora sphaerica]|uniref:Uncharacterized protein n=1 Tax=Planomonospora sphaerica TaxID=161355 RepID=A0A171DLG1_9ACTN|nr:hypothetical protein [Planomonospora sphaerica]GAT69720.1 hypothetical protein PS9374_05397 [Planomonospora sphaerica]
MTDHRHSKRRTGTEDESVHARRGPGPDPITKGDCHDEPLGKESA